MNARRQSTLRFFALLFLLPGLAGLLVSSLVSAHYVETLPKIPIPAESRVTPRNIHGTVVYQTTNEDRRLMIMEDISVGVFLVGLGLGLVYLRIWGVSNAIGGEEDEYEAQRP
jgi:hypothetical protein